MAKSYTLLLNTGYAESAAVYFTPFRSVGKHKDAKAALLSLAEWLKHNHAQSRRRPRPCCVKAAENASNDFCPKCGRNIERDQYFDVEGFRDWIVEVCSSTSDDIGANEYFEERDDPEWEIGILESLSSARVIFQAEEVLAAAVGHSSREQITFESICEDRTRNKSKDFSFW